MNFFFKKSSKQNHYFSFFPNSTCFWQNNQKPVNNYHYSPNDDQSIHHDGFFNLNKTNYSLKYATIIIREESFLLQRTCGAAISYIFFQNIDQIVYCSVIEKHNRWFGLLLGLNYKSKSAVQHKCGAVISYNFF